MKNKIGREWGSGSTRKKQRAKRRRLGKERQEKLGWDCPFSCVAVKVLSRQCDAQKKQVQNSGSRKNLGSLASAVLVHQCDSSNLPKRLAAVRPTAHVHSTGKDSVHVVSQVRTVTSFLEIFGLVTNTAMSSWWTELE